MIAHAHVGIWDLTLKMAWKTPCLAICVDMGDQCTFSSLSALSCKTITITLK